MDWMAITTRTIDLGYEQFITLEGRPGTRVRVLYGSMWLTEEGDLRDHFVHCGDEVTLSSAGRTVIEGLGAARVQLVEAARPARLAAAIGRLRTAWQGWRPRMRNAFARSMLMIAAVVVSIAVLHVAVPGPLARHDATLTAQSQARPQGVLGAVLEHVASAGTGFLAVN